MKKNLQFTFFVIGISLFSFLINAYPQIPEKPNPTWYIDKINDNDSPYQQKKIIEYKVRDDPNCEAFPPKLYSEFAKDNNPHEIWINFNYTEDLENPTLFIKAAVESDVSQDIDYNLTIYKREKFMINKKPMNKKSLILYEFPIGYLKKGLHEENRIIIKIDSLSYVPIVFDRLWLLQKSEDTDEDGISDNDEGDEKVSKDKTTAAIPIRSYDPKEIERIILHIKETEKLSPYFKEVGFLDANTLNLPEYIFSSLYFPYGFLNFRIEGLEPREQAVLQIGFEDILYPSVRFYTYQDTNQWEETIFNNIDSNSVDIILSDGGKGDFNGQKDGSIHTKLFLAYPHGLGVHIEKKGCFIEGISPKRENIQ